MDLNVEQTEVLVANFSRRLSGINSTLETVSAAQISKTPLAVIGMPSPAKLPNLIWWDVWRLWRKPVSKPFRIFHARRNNDMVVGKL